MLLFKRKEDIWLQRLLSWSRFSYWLNGGNWLDMELKNWLKLWGHVKTRCSGVLIHVSIILITWEYYEVRNLNTNAAQTTINNPLPKRTFNNTCGSIKQKHKKLFQPCLKPKPKQSKNNPSTYSYKIAYCNNKKNKT